jgi:translation initiation factor IF-2
LRIIWKAEVPYVIALNKCDLGSAEPKRLKRELIEYGVDENETEVITLIKQFLFF